MIKLAEDQIGNMVDGAGTARRDEDVLEMCFRAKAGFAKEPFPSFMLTAEEKLQRPLISKDPSKCQHSRAEE